MDKVIPPLIFEDEGFTLDLSHSGMFIRDVESLLPALADAHSEMMALEAGAVKNEDEQRQVTHFTDRLTYEQTPVAQDIDDFFERLRRGKFSGDAGRPFAFVVINGIGGSALGPQLLQMAMRGPYWNEKDKFERNNYPRIYFLDNTDPAGLQDVMDVVELDRTLVVTISKSGGTQESRNNMQALEQAFEAEKLSFAAHAAAVTMAGSELDQYARRQNWRKIWNMPESIGGRTSVTSVVGHVPAVTTGIDFHAFLDGARTMDEWTREPDVWLNPAYLLAAAWHVLGNGKGDRNMVIVPYADRLVLLSRYLQQLVMESLGKERDRQGNEVRQGLTVYGNKGGTDAHAYIQQLQEGRDDYFITFIEVLRDSRHVPLNSLTMGDYLHGFLSGLMLSLYARDRSVTAITVENLNERTLGMLVALYERTVAVYAELINVNAYHQPGVQAYKRVSKSINDINHALQIYIGRSPGFEGYAGDFAEAVALGDWVEEVEGILAKFTLNERQFGGRMVTRELIDGRWRYSVIG